LGSPLAHHSSFGRLYRESDSPFFSEPVESWDKIIADPRPLFDLTVVPPVQMAWDFSDPISPICTTTNRSSDLSSHISSRVDVLAWYAPAHTHTEDVYGIHLTQVGIVKSASAIQELLRIAGTSISRRSAAIIAAYVIYCHELAHALVEDVASVVEFSVGASRYTLFQRAAGHYAIMEEVAVHSMRMAWRPESRSGFTA